MTRNLRSLASYAQSGTFGLINYVTYNRSQGTFNVEALGNGKYNYQFEVSTDDGDSPGNPNDTVNVPQGTVTLQGLDTSGAST